MIATRVLVFLLPFSFFLLPSISPPTLAQSQTTGRIAGTVKDHTGAVIAGAEVIIISRATGENRSITTDDRGSYAVPLLPPGAYCVTITANGFKKTPLDNVEVVITETTPLNAELLVGSIAEQSITISAAPPIVQSEGPQLGRVVDSRGVSELPLATRNFTQILALSPGVVLALIDSTAVGSNSQSMSVNGARVSQNNYQINGVDANNFVTNNALYLAVPAPETIQEFKVQTSLYDATFGHSGGGNVQAVTKSGGNVFHGAAYEYFRDDVLNANNPFLKAADVKRPVLKRNVFGGALGGPIKKEKAFFFISYQGARERNGASPSSLSSNILVAQGLTDDRSEPTLLKTFDVPSVHPVALALLNAKLPNGQFLIPTPQADGNYSGSALSRYREDQFNTNFDYLINGRNWFAARFFFANAPQTLALNEGANSANVPGFGAEQENNNRVISLQHIHTFNPRVINEARLGYNFIRGVSFPQEPLKDSDVGIKRATANAYPGLPLINIGSVVIGTSSGVIDRQFTAPSTTVADILSITRGKHNLRVGAEVIYYEINFTRPFFTYGTITFREFKDFLRGAASNSSLGNGIPYSALRTTDYNFFVQDDWRLSSSLTINLGLRYELDKPPSDTRGRLSTFDPSLYVPRPISDTAVTGLLVPLGGFVQAGNVIAQYDRPEIPNVSKTLLRSVDPNNFAPRVGFAYSPLSSDRLVVRAGYGLYYSRMAAVSTLNSRNAPPYSVVDRTDRPPSVQDPFPLLPPRDAFPLFVRGISLSTQVIDRNMRTPYLHQYNLSLQSSVGKDIALEVAYVGTRGLNQQRLVAINQPRLASPQHPIVNEVTGEVITTNISNNAALRAPFQGVVPNGFLQNQQTAQSSYNSLQVSLTRRLSHGAQLLASYTYAKSLDNASEGPFGQAGAGNVGDVSRIRGDQLDNRANRGVSDFDRTHRLVISGIWDLPSSTFAARSTAGRWLLSNWQVAGIAVAMSGLPIDIVDSGAGSFYGFKNGAETLTRPNWAAGASRTTATSNIPSGYFFNPFAFARPVVNAGQPIPSSKGTAIAGERGTDLGGLGRNVLRGPKQSNVDFSAIKRFRIDESKNIEFRAEFFNLLNQVNLANPISNFNAIESSGGRIGKKTGRVITPGNFGRITSTSNNPRIIQFALKFNY